MSSPEPAPPRPATTEPSVAQWLTAEERQDAGLALVPVSHAEKAVRAAWDALALRWPATRGTRTRVLLLARRAEALVEGPRSRLARAAARAPRPWSLEDGPLARVLEQASAVEREAAELAAVIDRARAMREELTQLRARYAGELPRACDRMLARRGVSEEGIDSAASAEELDAIAYWLGRASAGLAAWHAEVSEWLARNAEDTGPAGEIEVAPEAMPPLVALETRYELLLTIGAVDRGPALRRNAAELRSFVRRHLDVVASTARLGSEDAILRAAREYSGSQTAAAVGAEEAWTYREALSHYHRLHRERLRADGDG